MPEKIRKKFICVVCDESPAKFQCGKCHSVDYCSKQCQKKDWSRHKELCAPAVFVELDHIGRGLVATKNIKKGELIFRAKASINIHQPLGFDSKEFDIRGFMNSKEERDQFYKLPKFEDP